MALVAYDNSDSSEFEDDSIASEKIITKIEPTFSKTLTEINSDDGDGPALFQLLPQPANMKKSCVEEDDEFLHKKETASNIVKPKAKITVPSLSDFKDVDVSTPSVKPKLSNGKKSGLLSMLPQPRYAAISTKSLIPQVVSQKPKSDTAKKKVPLPVQLKKPDSVKRTSGIDYSDDSDNDEEVRNDFFSINKEIETPVEELPLDIDSKSNETLKTKQKEPRSIESYFKKDDVNLQPDAVEPSSSENYESEDSNTNNVALNSNSTDVVLDDEAILKLCGARGKRKRENIQIVDVNQQEVLADAREWLLKGLMDDTSTRVSASKKRGHEPTSQQKRKHQITYLAHQAKANEAELQNQWANNRTTKRKTQSKYGF